MKLNVEKEVAAMQRMEVKDLRAKYVELLPFARYASFFVSSIVSAVSRETTELTCELTASVTSLISSVRLNPDQSGLTASYKSSD